MSEISPSSPRARTKAITNRHIQRMASNLLAAASVTTIFAAKANDVAIADYLAEQDTIATKIASHQQVD